MLFSRTGRPGDGAVTGGTAAFDHRDAGTPESAWTPRLRDVAQVPAPGAAARLLVVAAHPDDETLGCGGLVAAAARAGAEVRVLLATDGEASHPDSPTTTSEKLRALRRNETAEAVRVLAPDAELIRLTLPDGKVCAHENELRIAIRDAAVGCTHLLTPYAADGHPDHDVCGRAGASVAAELGVRHWQYPIWLWHRAAPDDADVPWQQLRAVPLDAAARQEKDAALDAYRSQHAPLSAAPGDEAILSPTTLEHFRRPAEYVVVTDAADAGGAAFFDDLYAAAADPWGLADRFYERRKRALLLASLPRERFDRAFEPGCATGLLTRELARRCGEVVAWDLAERALAAARTAVGTAAAVDFGLGRIPDDWPVGRFDLVVLSEVGYYCLDLDRLRRRVTGSLTDDGVLVACHWRHEAAAHPHRAEAVHRALGAELRLVAEHVEEDFLLHVWSRTGTSVATAEGIVSRSAQ